MALFKKQAQSNSFLGIDIGSGAIKIVELTSEKKRAKLMTYGYSEVLPGQGKTLLDDPKKTAELLSKIMKSADVKTNRAMAALPSSSVFSAIITIPERKTEQEMKPLIDAEAAKLTPLPIQEMITYSTFIDRKKPEPPAKNKKDKKKKEEKEEQKPAPVKKGYVRVLVTGAAKNLVQKYVEIFSAAKLNLEAIDTESFALIRSLVGKDRSSIMLVDIGYSKTNLTIVEKGIPMLTRSINIGGQMVTQKIMEQMSVQEPQAEQLKRDLATAESSGEMPAFLEFILQPIIHEIRYSFQLYANLEAAERDKVDKVILTGGSAHLPNLADQLANTLNMNVYRGDPWARVVYPAALRPALDDVGPRMSVAIGLAMRELD